MPDLAPAGQERGRQRGVLHGGVQQRVAPRQRILVQRPVRHLQARALAGRGGLQDLHKLLPHALPRESIRTIARARGSLHLLTK